ncbi:MAG TPA: FtsX-like permease family protein [Blastocatellia bacterium]|nr:FtsX-like permease family protein [Blastocatellia bacterium]
MFTQLAYITWQQWRQHRLRTALTLLGIALGVAVFFAVRTANLTLVNSLTVTIEKLAGKATLQIVAGEAGFPENVWDTVRDTPGVKVAEPVIEVIANTAFADEGNLLIVGVDMLGDSELREYQFDESQSEIGDPLVTLAQPDSILVSRGFAEKHGLKEGDKLPLFTSQGRKEFTIRGVFKPAGVGEVFGGQVAVMDVFNAQFVFNRGRNFDRIDLMNKSDVPVAELKKRLRERLPAGIEVTEPSARGQGIENAISAMKIGFTVASFIALLVGVFIIFNTFSISVNQRWKEIGILRALGVERPNVQRMFLLEAVLMGLTGSALGVVMGFYLAIGAERVMSQVAASVFGYISTQQPPVFRRDYALTSFAIGVAASVIAAWLPARAASLLNPVLALHNIETRQSETLLGGPRLVFGFLLVTTGFVLTAFAPAQAGMFGQFAYSLLMTLGLIVLLPKLSEWTARGLRPLMDRLFGSEGVLAVDSMIQSPRRTSATVGALMIGLMFVFSTGAYVQSYQRTVSRWMDRMINSDIIISASEMARSRTWHFSEEITRKVAAVPGISRVEQARFTFVPYADDSVALVSLEMDGWFARVRDVIEGSSEAQAREQMVRGEGVLVARNFVSRYNLGVGDHLRLMTPTGEFDRPIVGIIEDYTSEKGSIFMDRELYKKYWRDDAVDMIELNLKPGADLATVRNAVQQAIRGQQRAFIYTNAEYKAWVMNLINGFFVLNYMQMFVAILIAALGIINTLIISVSERKREFGVIRAIGGLRGQIRRMVLLEAVAIAIIGVITGALCGALQTFFLVRTAATMIGGYTIPFHFSLPLVLIALPVVLIIALAAAWWPARKAVSLRVVEAIGYE